MNFTKDKTKLGYRGYRSRRSRQGLHWPATRRFGCHSAKVRSGTVSGCGKGRVKGAARFRGQSRWFHDESRRWQPGAFSGSGRFQRGAQDLPQLGRNHLRLVAQHGDMPQTRDFVERAVRSQIGDDFAHRRSRLNVFRKGHDVERYRDIPPRLGQADPKSVRQRLTPRHGKRPVYPAGRRRIIHDICSGHKCPELSLLMDSTEQNACGTDFRCRASASSFGRKS